MSVFVSFASSLSDVSGNLEGQDGLCVLYSDDGFMKSALRIAVLATSSPGPAYADAGNDVYV